MLTFSTLLSFIIPPPQNVCVWRVGGGYNGFALLRPSVSIIVSAL